MVNVRVSKSTHLDTTVDEAWAVVSDFGGYASWQPHIASVEMQADGVRKVTFTRGDSVLDQVTAQDDDARSLTYGLVPGQATPMTKLDATFVVTGSGSGADVEYTIEVDVPEEMKGMAEGGIGADIDGALAGLDTRFSG